jgi:MFS family permease
VAGRSYRYTASFKSPVTGTAIVTCQGVDSGLMVKPDDTVGLGSVALVAGPATPYLALMPGLLVAGVGISMAIPTVQSAVIGAVPPQAIGKASGTRNTFRQLGGVFGIALAIAVFTRTGDFTSPASFTDGFSPALLVTAVLSLLGAGSAVLVPARRAQ